MKMESANKKHLADGDNKTRCCNKQLTYLALFCAISSIAVQSYNFVANKNGIKISNVVPSNTIRYIDDRIETKIHEHFLKTSEESHRKVKREALMKTAQIQEDNTLAPHVEFFNPKMRSQLEEKDALEMKETGAKGPAPGGDTWVWLTSYSRVPYKVVQGFCRATQDYCPPGVQGPKGPVGAPGPKGDRGDPGLLGTPGLAGARGPHGPPGPKGDRGATGKTGLDGRDGLPGEPGLDGLSGRNGADGAPGSDGRDGIPGKDGSPGKNGKDGKDGRVGAPGVQGPRGMKGDRGPVGPKGQRGNDGRDGMAGRPGLSMYNYTKEKELLIPPTFAQDNTRVIVRERDTLRITCKPSGKPEPDVEWRRSDGTPIIQGSIRDASVSGNVLKIINVSRWHTGKYVCLANNGLLPPANQTTDVEVYFSPYIRSSNVAYAYNNTAKITCEIQAWPEAVLAWETDGVTLDGPRYKTKVQSTSEPWRWIMTLEFYGVRESDYKPYKCVAKNELNNQTVKAQIQLLKPNPNAPPPQQHPIEFGDRPPNLTSYEELCELETKKCPNCPRCDQAQYRISSMNASNSNFNPFTNRKNTNCRLSAIGKPVYYRSKDEMFGAWLRDSNATEVEREKHWTTQGNDVERLREYKTKSHFKNDHVDEFHKLQKPFFGNGHIVYSGSFFYQANDTGEPADIIRYDLTQRRIKSVFLPYAGGRLYAMQHNQVDFNADDNGLWAIYSMKNSNNTAVAKLSFDPGRDDLNIDYLWNISLNHKQMGEMFIACGVLYALDSTTDRESRVSVGIDLFNNKLVELPTNLNFTNPFRSTTQLGFDHFHKELYSWDRGNQLTYPLLLSDN